MKPIFLLLLLGVFHSAVHADEQCPNIRNLFPRNRWGGRPPRNESLIKNFDETPRFVLIHHSNAGQCLSHASCAVQMRSLQAAGVINGTNDVNTNYAIGGNGMVYEGRGWTVQSETRADVDKYIFAVTLFGTFHNVLPTQRQIASLRALLECATSRGHVRSDFQFIAHRQVQQMVPCPGDALFKYMETWPRFNRNPFRRASERAAAEGEQVVLEQSIPEDEHAY